MSARSHSTADPQISIVVPVYRTPFNLVRDCLASIAGQTAGGFEVVVVENGSGAEYAQMLRTLVTTVLDGHAVRLIEVVDNESPAVGRNAGAAAARGEFLMFVDSDDIIEPRMIEAVRPALRDGCAVTYTNHVHVTYGGGGVTHVRDKRIYQRLLTEFAGTSDDPLIHATFVHHCLVVRRSEFDAVGRFRTDLRYGEEDEVPMLIAERVGPAGVSLVPEVLYRYRANPVSMMHQPSIVDRVFANRVAIMVAAARRRGFPASTGERLGRAQDTNAPHYALYDDRGRRLSASWFDYDALTIRPEVLDGLRPLP